jgi:hypothetical protein
VFFAACLMVRRTMLTEYQNSEWARLRRGGVRDSMDSAIYNRNSLVSVVSATLFPYRTARFSTTGLRCSLQHKRAAE